MRLLDVWSLTLSKFGNNEVPPYAILSHRWTSDEATYTDVSKRQNIKSAGYSKLSRAANYVRTELRDIRWLWVDTCCIDKSSSAELSEAINSMFRWYREAAVCFAYLADVTASEDLDMFKGSSWFTRGWTLQELLAPQKVLFFTREWDLIGHKGPRNAGLRCSIVLSTMSLEPAIEYATGIPRNVLHDYQHCNKIPTAEKWRWTEKRKTTREEDMVYCLLGLFDVALSVNYGEGFDEAMTRLSTQLRRKRSANGMSWDKDSFYSGCPRNSYFVDRPHEMEQIATKLAAPARRVALTGIGGIGKTQLAVEYIHRLKDTSPNTSVFWFSDSSAAPFESKLKNVVQQLMPASVDEHRRGNVVNHYRDNQSDNPTGTWLVVIDGFDEAGPLFDGQDLCEDEADDHSGVRAWFDLPSMRGDCSILITSRSKHTALQLVGCSEILEIGPLGMDEGALLVKRTLGGQSVDADGLAFKQLSMSLDNIPIAVAQVTRHIRTRRDTTSTAECIKNLLENKSSRLFVLESGASGPGHHQQAKDSVLSIWQSSFEYMARLRPSVIGILSVMSQCHHARCSRSFLTDLNLRYQPAGGEKVTTATSHDEHLLTEIDEDILFLLQHSFLTKSDEHEYLEMFELVQLSIRGWLIGRGQFDHLEAQYMGKLHEMFSRVHPKGHLEYGDLRPHMEMIRDSIPRSPDASLRWASLMHTAAWFALSVGNASEAQTMAQLSVKIRARELGSNHINTLSGMGLVALAKQGAGLLKDAADIGKEVVAKSTALLGKEHPLTLTNMANLSWTFQELGQWKEAEAVEQQVLDGTCKALGPDHPSTLASMHNLASILHQTGRLDTAQRLMHDVLTWEKKQLGDNHPATLTTTDNLALLLQSAGRLQEAEVLSRRAFGGFRLVLGLDHADTWTSSHNLASILRDCGKFQESCTLLRRTTAKREEILGKNHAHTLSSISSLASLLKDMEQYDEAEELNRTVLRTRERTLGPEHPQTLTSVSNLGLVLRCRGKYEEAEMLTRRALEGYRKTLGDDHPHTLTSVNNLADLLREQGYRRHHTAIEDREIRGSTQTQGTERATSKQKRSSIGSPYLTIRGYDGVKRSKTKLAQASAYHGRPRSVLG